MRGLVLPCILGLVACSGAEPVQQSNEDMPTAQTAPQPAATSNMSSEGSASPTRGTAPSSPDQPLAATGWGPLRIGMSVAEVVAALGPDSNSGAVGGPDPEACDQFHPARAPEGLLVMIEDGKLTRISLIDGATLRTDRGLGVGDSKAKVVSTYGASADETPHKYEAAPAVYVTVWKAGGGTGDYVQNAAARGIVYEIGANGRVQAIHAGGPSIQYVEGCA
ncbi:hypothetical protein [Allosphingosinicella deserti]|uniref:hypothetical protein n=1 Tax=Allosphingosinicella deserti TaxID=2116704 RepID=UPI000D0B3A46|nr:hypothetical protein [Sphingomonas deserti]